MTSLLKERKSQRFVARVTRKHKKPFARAAAIEARSVAAFVIGHALAAAEHANDDRRTIRLNTQQSRRFVEAMLAPVRDVPSALRRAQSEYKKRVVNPL